MSLENLAKIGQLRAHATDRAAVSQLLEAAERNLVDARNGENSAETRFDCGYRAIMQAALVALQANGYRPDNKRPGHNALTIQSLTLTLGIEGARVAVLDKMREKRNLADYMGANLDEAATQSCIAQATRLLAEVRAWLATNRPELL